MKCSTETHKNKKILTKITFSSIQGLLLIMLISVYKNIAKVFSPRNLMEGSI